MVETKVYDINPVSRIIDIPSSTVIGVESDENVERIRFQCDRFVGDNVDLSSFNLYVNYQNANGEKNIYLIDDIVSDDSTITFSWLLSREVTKYKGLIKFIVCAKRSNSTTNEWNTRVATASVIEGLEAEEVIVEQKADVLEQILARLTSLEHGGGDDGANLITANPVDQTASDGQTVNFRVTTRTDGTYTYKWYYKASAGDSWHATAMTGNDTDTLTVDVTTARNGYQYKCIVKHGNRTEESLPATLIVVTGGSGGSGGSYGGLSETAITLLSALLDHVIYSDPAGGSMANALIAELRKGSAPSNPADPTRTNQVTQGGSVLTVNDVATLPTQSGSILLFA